MPSLTRDGDWVRVTMETSLSRGRIDVRFGESSSGTDQPQIGPLSLNGTADSTRGGTALDKQFVEDEMRRALAGMDQLPTVIELRYDPCGDCREGMYAYMIRAAADAFRSD